VLFAAAAALGEIRFKTDTIMLTAPAAMKTFLTVGLFIKGIFFKNPPTTPLLLDRFLLLLLLIGALLGDLRLVTRRLTRLAPDFTLLLTLEPVFLALARKAACAFLILRLAAAICLREAMIAIAKSCVYYRRLAYWLFPQEIGRQN